MREQAVLSLTIEQLVHRTKRFEEEDGDAGKIEPTAFMKRLALSALVEEAHGTRRYEVAASDIFHELSRLRKEIDELRRKVGLAPPRQSRGDRVYMKLREFLEKDHMGKIVALDIESQSVVGISDTVLGAYEIAKRDTGKTKFVFKRVGSDSLLSL